jgi:hypothetical protein
MSTARRDGRIAYSVFEDRTRHSVEGEYPNPSIDDKEAIFNDATYMYENAEETALDNLKDADSNFDLPFWFNQPIYIEVWLEKEALANILQPIAAKYHVSFVPCRGYPSLSLLYDCANRLRTVPKDREIRILYFGDYDVRGLNIEETVERNLLEDFGIHANVIRYALTKEQIEKFQLPSNPAKTTDSMVRGWIETHGNVAWELDALEPHELDKIVTEAITQQIDTTILNERTETVQKNREWIRSKVSDYLKENEVE